MKRFRVQVLRIYGMRYIFVSWCSAMNFDLRWGVGGVGWYGKSS
jgi:hypothetical protein